MSVTRKMGITMGRRVSTKQLAEIWIVTPERVGQIARAGKIHKGQDGLFDLDAAMTFRKQQISDQEVNTLLKTYGSRHGTTTGMKVLDHLLSAEEVLAEPVEENSVAATASAFDQIVSKLYDIVGEVLFDIMPNVATRCQGMNVDPKFLREVELESYEALDTVQKLAFERCGFLWTAP